MSEPRGLVREPAPRHTAPESSRSGVDCNETGHPRVSSGMTGGMLSRRSLVQAIALAGLLAGTGALAACGDGGDGRFH